jgi:ketosteroid isomerase-like protein
VQAAIASRFHDGNSELEVVQTIVSGDIVCLVAVEHNTVRFDDEPKERAWTLRVTMVFRRDGPGWTLLHRHADPLVERRELGATLGLLDGGT